jgi:glyoxylase-like metal-dependent hydrolase (beta-lactamase superfamily II)
MKTKIIFSCTIALFLVTSIFAQNKAKIEVSKLTENIYKLEATTTYSVNMLAYVGDGGILLVDDCMAGASEAIQAELKKLSPKPIKYIISTHAHADHTGGNKLFGKDAIIIAHSNVRKQLTSGLNILQEFPEKSLPDKSIDKEMSLDFGGETIKIIPLPGGHSDSDLIVWFKKSNVVCMGSLLLTNQLPFIDYQAGGDIKAYPKNIEKAISILPDDAVLVAGHGEDATMDKLKNYGEMITSTMAIVQNGLADGKTVDDLVTEKVLANYDSWANGFVTTDFWTRLIATGINNEKKVNKPTKESIAIPLYYTVKEKNAEAAIKQYRELKKNKPDDYDFSEQGLNILGYYLLGKNRFDDAIEIFNLNIEIFPNSWNVYDSLGEAYMKSGNTDLAIKNYKKSLEINPGNANGEKFLKQLQNK